MRQDIEALLQPSLAARPSAAIVSVRATFMVAFFGGPIAAVLIMAFNSRRMGRLKQDALLYILMAALSVAYFGVMAVMLMDPAHSSSLPGGPRFTRFATRLVGLIVWGVLYLRHRSLHDASELGAATYQSPWVPGIACVVVGGALQAVLVLLQRGLAGTP